MIDCPNGDVRDLLPDFLHGRLDASRHAEVEQHLAGCEVCREELSLLRDLRATMSGAPRVHVDALAAAIPPYRAPARRGWVTGWRAAAAIVAIIVGGTSVALLRDRGAESAEPETTRVAVVAEGVPAGHDTGIVATVPESPGGPVQRQPDGGPSAPGPTSASANRGELAMAGGAIGELSDGELSALVEGIESLEAIPSAEVEGAETLDAGVQGELR
jgi:hypothetical protein